MSKLLNATDDEALLGTPEPPASPKKRVQALDAFRGFNIMLMIFVDNVGGWVDGRLVGWVGGRGGFGGVGENMAADFAFTIQWLGL